MKNPWEWEEEDLSSLIKDEVQESINLDYKRSESLANNDPRKNEISKDVSAFANSAGGTLVYGIAEKNNLPTHIDDGLDPALITREWIEHVINSRIHRRIDGIRIKQIELKTIRPGRVAYTVSIPQSQRAPHQAHDKKFYKRFNFESTAMEEYEIRDVARRSESPDLRITWTPVLAGDDKAPLTPLTVPSTPLFLSMSIANDAPTPAEYVIGLIQIDSRLNTTSWDLNKITKLGILTTIVDNVSRQVDYFYFKIGIPGSFPIFQGVEFAILESPFLLFVPNLPESYILYYELKSPRMTIKSQYSFLTFKNNQVFLS